MANSSLVGPAVKVVVNEVPREGESAEKVPPVEVIEKLEASARMGELTRRGVTVHTVLPVPAARCEAAHTTELVASGTRYMLRVKFTPDRPSLNVYTPLVEPAVK
jgi:hypothetical protein